MLKQLIYSHPSNILKSDKITLKTLASDLLLRILSDDLRILFEIACGFCQQAKFASFDFVNQYSPD